MKIHELDVYPALPERIAALSEIAANVWSTWTAEARALFTRLDPDLWETVERNPSALLRRVAQERLDAAAADASYVAEVARVVARQRAYLADPGRLAGLGAEAGSRPMLVAYFSLEFGLDAGIPLYSGGLGVLAGDHLKAASDVGVPLVGVGLMYGNGYFRQSLGPDGGQREGYPPTDHADLPLTDQLDPAGRPVVVEVQVGPELVRAAVRRIQVGRVPLLLLDSDIAGNSDAARGITGTLYGGDREMRIRQEVLLGVGGVRALAAAGLTPSVFHMNEGHSALLAIERIRSLMADSGLGVAEAREVVVASTVFTTHTPVPAGNETFDLGLARAYLEPLAAAIDMSWDELADLASHPDGQAMFGMTPLALRTSGFANGVAELHGDTSRRMWHGLWPELPVDEVPITSITNGIHHPTWISRELSELLDRYVGPALLERPDDPEVWAAAAAIPAGELWRVHELRRERLVLLARRRLQAQLARQNGSRRVAAGAAEEALRPDALTICFARRFATYKRANLLFRDPERLARLLGDEERPVQIVIAGKAHPLDVPGKDVLRGVVQFTQRAEVRDRVVFLEDYDMHMARYLVQGADVWLNIPRRPLEASGTSGMKAAVNGALNLSVLDGWWAEGYGPDCGWAIGGGEVYDDPEENDAVEAEALYTLLEREVVPTFFARDATGRPREWIQMMLAAVSRLGGRFNTARMVREYAERAYAPAHTRARALRADGGAAATARVAWAARINAAWPEVALRSEATVPARVAVGHEVEVEVFARLGALSAEDVAVEVVVGTLEAGALVAREVIAADPAGPRGDEHRFVARVPATSSGRLAWAARVVALSPGSGEPDRGFAVTWEPAA